MIHSGGNQMNLSKAYFFGFTAFILLTSQAFAQSPAIAKTCTDISGTYLIDEGQFEGSNIHRGPTPVTYTQTGCDLLVEDGQTYDDSYELDGRSVASSMKNAAGTYNYVIQSWATQTSIVIHSSVDFISANHSSLDYFGNQVTTITTTTEGHLIINFERYSAYKDSKRVIQNEKWNTLGTKVK